MLKGLAFRTFPQAGQEKRIMGGILGSAESVMVVCVGGLGEVGGPTTPTHPASLIGCPPVFLPEPQ